jgi:hypothetical protein
MIEFIWFDLGYTLLYKKREEAYRAVLADFGVEASVSDIARAFHLADKKFMREFPAFSDGRWSSSCPGTWGSLTTISAFPSISAR